MLDEVPILVNHDCDALQELVLSEHCEESKNQLRKKVRMSRLNGDRARFHKGRRNKLRRRQRVRALLAAFHAQATDKTALKP